VTPAEILPILTEWRDTIRKAEADISEYIAPLRPIPESPLYDIPWRLMDAYTHAVSARIGDQAEWLAWYWADNEMGAKAMELRVAGKTYKVRTLKQLARVIVESQE
jgi:hypothetical protein